MAHGVAGYSFRDTSSMCGISYGFLYHSLMNMMPADYIRTWVLGQSACREKKSPTQLVFYIGLLSG